MTFTVRTTIAALGAAAALTLGACSDSDDDLAGAETTPAAGESAVPDDTGEQTSAGATEEPADEGETEGETAPQDESETGGEGETADVFEVALGDCIGRFEAEGEVSDVTVVPCDQEHDQEVFAVLEVPDGDFPGAEAFKAQVEKDCVAEFKSFVGVDYSDSELDIQWLEPTEESWSQGDRELVCTVFDPAGPVAGTLEAANR